MVLDGQSQRCLYTRVRVLHNLQGLSTRMGDVLGAATAQIQAAPWAPILQAASWQSGMSPRSDEAGTPPAT